MAFGPRRTSLVQILATKLCVERQAERLTKGASTFLFPFLKACVAPAHELMQRERHLIGMRRAPRNDSLQLDGIVGDGADLHQLGIDDLRGSHGTSSMAHV